VIGVIFAVCISIVLPLIPFLYAFIKKRYIPFLLGVIAFVGSQVLIRIPLLEYLQTHSTTYAMFSAMRPVLFAVVIGLSAGVLEEMARFVMMYFLMKQRDWQSGFLFGAGHGGIEALLFVGLGSVTMLFSPTANVHDLDFFVGGIERFFAMLLHIGLSIIILQAVVQKRFFLVVLAIVIHGCMDALVGILPLFMPPNTALIAIEVLVAIVSLLVFWYSLRIKRREGLQ